MRHGTFELGNEILNLLLFLFSRILVPDGELTPKMWALKIGDKMSVRQRAKGIFVQDKTMHHHFMLSTVTGVAPTVSMGPIDHARLAVASISVITVWTMPGNPPPP